ncbi:hypothetical protein [Chitinophaga rhizophila]|uniref:Uncharacterized protein n=1 Tax=Chitinophaga rhizophila TaxID=2866212 RepID=A0ABS7GMR3_9BACT|nr:hypothetical protein [Chitinophaga rhizophila]MBW8688172.1 hypothetical protein [Chitinophaga rhizophila]
MEQTTSLRLRNCPNENRLNDLLERLPMQSVNATANLTSRLSLTLFLSLLLLRLPLPLLLSL